MNRGQRYMLLMNARHELRAALRTVERLAEQLRDTDCAAPLQAAAFSVHGAAQQLDMLSGLAPRAPARMPRTKTASHEGERIFPAGDNAAVLRGLANREGTHVALVNAQGTLIATVDVRAGGPADLTRKEA